MALDALECDSSLHPEEAVIISVLIVSLLVVFWFVFVGNGV